MKEVSTKALDPFVRAAARRGIGIAELAAGVGYAPAHLSDRHERIEWDAFVRFMTNVCRRFSNEELTQIGEDGLRSPFVRSALVVGRTLLSPAGFYRWLLSSGGLGNRLFSCIVPTYRELDDRRLVVELRMAPGYEPCDAFFHYALGGLRGLPAVMGLDRARVEMARIDAGVRFAIDLPEAPGLRWKLTKLITRREDARTAAADLDDAMRALERRYAELEVTRAAVERQKALLDTAYRVGHAIWGELEPRMIGESVARSLVEIAGFDGAQVDLAGAGDQRADARFGATGTGPRLDVDLTGRRVGGRLAVWLTAGADRGDAETLLGLLAPTVALAIDNAFAYRELAIYQQHLERLVEERTGELRRARDDLAETVGQLRDAIAARERIFANISHEIRTPLSLILLAVADVEARAPHLDPEARADLGSVVDSARKLLRLVDELLLLAAGEETALALAPEPTDLARLVTALGQTWRLAAEAAGLTLRIDAPASLAATIDPVAIERVITNLLSNAVKFTPAGGRVSVSLARGPVGIRLAVRDTGVGIDDELLPRLFGRFERAKVTRRGGSGIGLSLVRELVVAHGGEVGVERVPGGGTEIWVTLPDVAGATLAPPTELAPRLRPADYGVVAASVRSGEVLEPARRSAITILVAEDDPQLATMIARRLAAEYTVVVALDGVAALALAQQHQPHLLVTDVQMPGMDGLELTRQFREVTRNSLAPVVILSAMADLGDRLAGFEAGALDYVVKPFDPRDLMARVRAQLGVRELALRLHRAEQLSALGTLSAGLAHELRNPANAIVNAVGPLKKLLPADLSVPAHPVAQLVDVLAGCAEQIGMLSRQLLSFRRGGELELRVVAVDDVVQRAIVLAQPALRGVTIRATGALATPLRCAPPLLVQVVNNLIENAAHAAGAGGWIEIAVDVVDALVTIEVTDSGPGVPAELRDRVFEPFFTTKPPGAGTGLGLPLARDIVHRHGGVLEIREHDHRPRFVVELPQAAAEPARREQERTR